MKWLGTAGALLAALPEPLLPHAAAVAAQGGATWMRPC